MILASSNFGFLADQEPRLVALGALAERYFPEDPSTALFKVRQFAELLAKLVAAHHRAYEGERETFEETLRRLAFERILPREVSDVFHQLRKLGNVAAHEEGGNHSDALGALKLARQLGVWFYRVYAKQPGFKPGPFTPPAAPVDATADLKAEIESLQRRVSVKGGGVSIPDPRFIGELRTRPSAPIFYDPELIRLPEVLSGKLLLMQSAGHHVRLQTANVLTREPEAGYEPIKGAATGSTSIPARTIRPAIGREQLGRQHGL